MQLIISDEEKHRAVNHAMIATLRGSLTWTKPEGSLEGAADLTESNSSAPGSIEEFIEIEKEGIRECKTLIKESDRILPWRLQNSFRLDDKRFGKAHRAARIPERENLKRRMSTVEPFDPLIRFAEIERLVSKIYFRFSHLFLPQPKLRDFWWEMAKEEEQHGCILNACRAIIENYEDEKLDPTVSRHKADELKSGCCLFEPRGGFDRRRRSIPHGVRNRNV